MNLKKLTKAELIHFIESTHNDEDIVKKVVANRKHQIEYDIDCWDCKRIAEKLGIIVPEVKK